LLEDDSTNMWMCEDSLPNAAVAGLKEQSVNNAVGGAKHAFDFIVLRRVYGKDIWSCTLWVRMNCHEELSNSRPLSH
jgi:hypothetical protein